ncbi:MAG: ATP-binding protein [Proteobacteria bacterium]|nr:ATP-binding protein [Pseudomonadota bacterium]
MKGLLIVGALVAAVGLFLLATASADTALFAQHYWQLLVLNAALAALLAALVAFQLITLGRRLRARVFGTRLTLRLLLRFALLAVVPGLIVYTVSVQFLSRSIESWFDVKVDAALEGGINLGQQVIDQLLSELQTKGRAMSLELADRSHAQQVSMLDRLRDQAGVQEVVLVTAGGRLLASATEDLSRLVPEMPATQTLRQARSNRVYTSVDLVAGRPVALRVLAPVGIFAIADEARFLQLRQTIPAGLGRSAEAVEAAYRDYRELALSREGLKRIYIVTLTFALLIALFVAIGVSVTQSNLLAEPLANLAAATQAVARGDFSRRPPVTSRDEIGVLTESFNSMVTQLGDARQIVEANRIALETANAYLENVLANLSAGVLVLDRAYGLGLSNRGAAAILGPSLSAAATLTPAQWPGSLAAFGAVIHEALVAHGDEAWQREVSLETSGKSLLVRGSALPSATGGGYVLVFDDITQLIQAQRATAWAEVARRLAHEIKNPLTPIQLSAERLEMKLADRLGESDAEILRRATQTIVSQVGALKAMVDDFSDYARMPAPAPAALDLNALVTEVLALYETSDVPVTRQLVEELPRVLADSVQIRQVIHNLLRNAQDALENGPADQPRRIVVETSRTDDGVELAVSDTGGGFPEAMMTRVFEPYVTSKPRGTGLGLAIVKKIVDEHQGRISIENRVGVGATVRVFLPILAAGTAFVRAA